MTGVRTGKHLSVLLIERGEGVETKPIKTSYSAAAGTAYITFDNVKVPVENLLGEENKGIHVILSNFNHERWAMVCTSSPSTNLQSGANEVEQVVAPAFQEPLLRNA